VNCFRATANFIIDPVPKEAVHATSEVFSGLKEAAAQTTLASNASRTTADDNDGNRSQEEDKTAKT
jgi:hypothetical protein